MNNTIYRALTILFVCYLPSAYAVTADQIKQCVSNRLEQMRTSSLRPVSRSIAETCPPGHNEILKGCVGKENHDTNFSLHSNDGWKLVPGSGTVERTGGDTPDRTGVGLVSQNANEVVGRAWCNGHGCGGEGHIHVVGEIRAKEEKIPTEQDRNEALDACLHELIKK